VTAPHPRSMVGIFRLEEGASFVRVVYSDESGTGNLKDEPITVVAAIMLNLDSQWESINADLAQLPSRREFKGRSLYKDLRKNRHAIEADEMLRLLLSIPLDHHIPIFFGAVDRASFARNKKGMLGVGSLASSHTALDSAFEHCFDQVDSYALSAFPRERVLWIADHNEPKETDIRLRHSWFNIGVAVDVPGMMGLRPAKETHQPRIVDTLYFGHSKQSRLLQLADVCCSTIMLHLRKEQLAEPYYALIRRRVVHDGVGIWPI
jgi:Protein of unknown function (DUF3800)